LRIWPKKRNYPVFIRSLSGLFGNGDGFPQGAGPSLARQRARPKNPSKNLALKRYSGKINLRFGGTGPRALVVIIAR
jgi:hypothetical protein